MQLIRSSTETKQMAVKVEVSIAASSKEQESVRPRWPYDMRPSVRAENYIRDASGAEKT